MKSFGFLLAFGLIFGHAHAAAIQEDTQADADKVTFHLYTDKNNLRVTAGKKLDLKDDSTFENTNINPDETLVILVHGFMQVHSCSFPQDVKDAYLESDKTHNVITVDYGQLAQYGCKSDSFSISVCYSSAVNKVTVVSQQIASLIQKLAQKGLTSPQLVHVVGVSLGAHVAGIVGKDYLKDHGEKLGRVTGLDPAGPLFTGSKGNILDPNDAEYVDAVYTDMGNLGNSKVLAQINFYPNGGAHPQPGCEEQTETICSHSAAAQFFIQSIRDKRIKGYKCESYEQFNSGECGLQSGHTFGEHSADEPRQEGAFYLNIQPQSFSGRYTCGVET